MIWLGSCIMFGCDSMVLMLIKRTEMATLHSIWWKKVTQMSRTYCEVCLYFLSAVKRHGQTYGLLLFKNTAYIHDGNDNTHD